MDSRYYFRKKEKDRELFLLLRDEIDILDTYFLPVTQEAAGSTGPPERSRQPRHLLLQGLVVILSP